MSKMVYDTRFFIEHYYSDDKKVLQRTKEEIRKARGKFISAIVVHEVFWLTLGCEGRETALVRTDLLEKDFKVIDVNSQIAKDSAELRDKYKMSMADSIIAATALSLKAQCLSDDPHIRVVKEISTKWL
jgi:predicted nucleic acid-binding protein